MVHSNAFAPSALALAGSLLLAGCSQSSDSGNAAPRIGSIPRQQIGGGATLTLDLANYVTDREGGALDYQVVAGGGGFTGSSYSNSFPTMGSYTVKFTVADAAGKQSGGTFQVDVTSASFAVVQEIGSGLLLADAVTDQMVRVCGAAAAPTFAAGLSDGRMVYQVGNPAQLWLFDPMARISIRLAADNAGAVLFQGKTSDDRVVYATEGAVRRLHVYNPRTQLVRTIAENAPATGAVLVSGTDQVYFVKLDGSQGDVFAYEPATDSFTTVAATAADERLQAVLPDGALVLSRIGVGGEHDLFYFRAGIGLVEVGVGVTALDTLDKTFAAAGSASQVVFGATDGVHQELHAWSPVDGQTVAIHTGGTAHFAAIGAGNEVVYTIDNGGGDVDAACYDLDDATAVTLRNAADTTAVLAVAGSSPARALLMGSGDPSTVFAVTLTASPTTVAHAGGGAMQFARVLANGDALAQRVDGTQIAVLTAATGVWSTQSGVGLDVVGAGTDVGDFVFAQQTAGQGDLAMWDASAAAVVVIAAQPGEDVYQATLGGKVYFTRDDDLGHAQLHVCRVAAATATQLTQNDSTGLGFDHAVVGSFAGAR